MRVYELAKELGISSKELLKILSDMRIEAKSHSASIEASAADEVRRRIKGSPSQEPKPASKKSRQAVEKADEKRKPDAARVKADKKPAEKTEARAGVSPHKATADRAASQTTSEVRTSSVASGTPVAQEVQGKPVRASRSDAKRAAVSLKPEMGVAQRQRRSGKGSGRSRRHKAHYAVRTEEAIGAKEKTNRVIEVTEATTVAEFAELVRKPTTDIIRMLMKLGEMKTINQPISIDAMNIIAEEIGFQVKVVAPEEYGEEEFEEETALETKPPVVTVMGHVDHGKTSILDAIRQTDVISTEAGGITQHIGAYQVRHNEKPITFIDTPGHEAFTAMRARGAKVTDIAILVVAADDGVMPQTVEAINHAKAANVPIVVAINKIDKDNANPDKVKQELTEYGLIPEEWGGDTVMVQVSAKKRINIDDLLEVILLVAEMQELKATRRGHARGVCIESKLDKGRGPVATVLIHKGSLKAGDAFVAGLAYGRVRAMNDDKGNLMEIATPAQPVEVIGFSSVPHAGDEFRVVADERTAKEIAEERALKRRLIEAEKRRHITLEDLHKRISEGEVKDLNVIIKADVQGSIEAIRDALHKIAEKETEVRINVIHTGVGGITETDIMLASASDAIVVGFNVRPDVKAKAMAEQEKVDVRTYRVIYQVVEDVTDALTGMLAPELEEIEQGRVEVRDTFKSSRAGVIAGCFVTDGEIERNSRVRLVRDGTVIYEGQISSLKRFKEDARVVKAGYECGITLEDFQDVKVGDVIEAYRIVERQRQLGE